jgi:hypothetical protein
MTRESFYDVLNNPNITKESFQKICFKMDSKGPQYRVKLGDNYSTPKDAVENNDFTLEMTFPRNTPITNENSKNNILRKLIHTDKKF